MMSRLQRFRTLLLLTYPGELPQAITFRAFSAKTKKAVRTLVHTAYKS